MDENFLEFWGNMLINAARGKKQMNEFVVHMQKSMNELNDVFAKQSAASFSDTWSMFRKFYGIDKVPEKSPEYNTMINKAAQDFQNSIREYMAMFGIVSKDDHLTLVKKYESLKRKYAEQEETIRHMRMLLEAKQMGQNDIAANFQHIIREQGDMFQKMMKEFGKYFNKSHSNSEISEESIVKGESENNGNG